MATTAASRARATRAARTSGTSSSSKSSSSSSSSSSSTSGQIGLNQTQINQLRGLSGIDQKALNAYVSSGSAVGGSNNPNGRGRESISAADMTRVESPTLPTPPVPDNKGLDLGYINAGLGQTDAKGMFQIPKMGVLEGAGENEKAAVSSIDTLGQTIQGYLGINAPDKGANEKALVDSRRQAGVEAAQREFNRYQNQINSITAQRDAQVLGLEAQGRGQTTGFIGGEQARINREAAIQALPVQAQLAAAQGNLEQAKELMGQLYQAKSADIQADLSYRTNLVNTLVNFASSSQQTVLQAKLADNAQKAQIAQQNLAYQRQLGLQALEYGQNGLISGISNVDPKSPTFEQDIAEYTSKLRKPVAATSTKRDTQVVEGKLIDLQTGEVIADLSGTSVQNQDEAQKSLDQLSFLRDTANKAIELAGSGGLITTPVGPSMITKAIGATFVGNTSFKQLQNQTDTLKTNVLSLMTDPNVKKFFGPQMSNADVRLMSSTGSTLNPEEQNAKDYIQEVKRLDDLFNRMQTAVKVGLAGQSITGQNTITAPDGNLIEIID